MKRLKRRCDSSVTGKNLILFLCDVVIGGSHSPEVRAVVQVLPEP